MATPRPPDAGSCPLCDGCTSHPAFAVDGFEYFRCDGCGAARLAPLPTPEEQERLFGPSYFRGAAPGGYLDYRADEALHRRNARDRLKAIARMRPGAPGSLLDVGCASGYFLDEAARAGWAVEGVEVSEAVRSEAARQFALTVRQNLGDALAAGAARFQVVTFYQALEHLADPLTALRQAHDLLRPGGCLVVETWDLSSLVARASGRYWQQISPPSVAYLFDRDSLDRLFARAGFRGVRISATGKRVRLGFGFHLLAAKLPRLMGSVTRLAQTTGVDRATVRYALGDLVTAFARP